MSRFKVIKMRLANLSLILVVLLSCSDEQLDVNSFVDDQSITSLNGQWKVFSFEDYTNNKREFKTQANSRGLDIIVSFDESKSPNTVSGKNTTNTIEAEFEYKGARKIKISNYTSTLVAQPVWADQFNGAILDGEVTYKINAANLRIYYSNHTKSVTLKREQ